MSPNLLQVTENHIMHARQFSLVSHVRMHSEETAAREGHAISLACQDPSIT